MSDVESLKQERFRIFHDVYNNIVPERVPIDVSLMKEAVAGFTGVSVNETNWNIPSIARVADQICQKVYSDVCPVNFFSTRFPAQYEVTGSKSFLSSESGFVQHPEVCGMPVEDYDYLIEHPLDCLYERVIPRLYEGLNGENPMLTALSLAKGLTAKNNDFFPMFGIGAKLNEKYGYYAQNGMARAMTTAPFDFVADQLRGFSKVSLDIRRMPDKLIAASDAVYPLMVKAGIPKMITPESRAYSFLHMPTFMREKDFAKLWWPSFLRMCNEHASMGIQVDTFCEDDWTRYVDYLYELPANTLLRFEKGDMRKIKDTLGKKHIIYGMYPISLLQGGTKEQCLDKAKEMLDILAPGGRYIFAIDKLIITSGSVNLDNLIAVTDYVHENGKYDNAGQTSGIPYNKEDYKVEPCKWPESKYYTSAQQYKERNPYITDAGAARLQATDDELFTYLINLLF